MKLTTAGEYLKSVGRAFPDPDLPDGAISGKAYEKAGLPIVVECSNCKMTMCLAPETATFAEPPEYAGKVLCSDCSEYL